MKNLARYFIFVCSIVSLLSYSVRAYAEDTEVSDIVKRATALAPTMALEFRVDFESVIPKDPEFQKLESERAVKTPDTEMSEAEIKSTFALLSKYSVSAPKKAFDGHCYARNFWWQNILRMLHLTTQSLVVKGKSLLFGLFYFDLHPADEVDWRYHIAPLVNVGNGAEKLWMVFDPSLFSEPVSISLWREAASGEGRFETKLVHFPGRTVNPSEKPDLKKNAWTNDDLRNMEPAFKDSEFPTVRREPIR